MYKTSYTTRTEQMIHKLPCELQTHIWRLFLDEMKKNVLDLMTTNQDDHVPTTQGIKKMLISFSEVFTNIHLSQCVHVPFHGINSVFTENFELKQLYYQIKENVLERGILHHMYLILNGFEDIFITYKYSSTYQIIVRLTIPEICHDHEDHMMIELRQVGKPMLILETKMHHNTCCDDNTIKSSNTGKKYAIPEHLLQVYKVLYEDVINNVDILHKNQDTLFIHKIERKCMRYSYSGMPQLLEPEDDFMYHISHGCQFADTYGPLMDEIEEQHPFVQTIYLK